MCVNPSACGGEGYRDTEIQRRSNRAFVDSANSTLPSFCFPFPSFVSAKQQNGYAATVDYFTQVKPLCDGNNRDLAGPAHP